MECYICQSNSEEKRISPGVTILQGKYWLVEHAYPSKLKGWLVIETKRHTESLHDLSKDEFAELSTISEKVAKLLHKELKCEKEYLVCFAEAEHFNHIHFHIIPKPKSLPDNMAGTKIFAMLKIEEKDAIPKKEIKDFCKLLKSKLL